MSSQAPFFHYLYFLFTFSSFVSVNIPQKGVFYLAMRHGFTEIDFPVMDSIERIRRACGHVQSSHSFVSLFLWRNAMELSVRIVDDAFVVACGGDFFFPCGGEMQKKAFIEEILCSNAGNSASAPRFLYCSAGDCDFCRSYFPDVFSILPDHACDEYIYDRAEQTEMRGKKFAYQRAKINKALRSGNLFSTALCAGNLPVARSITLDWAKRRSADSADVMQTLEAIENFDSLFLYGNILFRDSVPVGFNMGSFITEDTFDIHIAKTLEDDVDALMKLELYKALPDRVKYINREEDLGISGLRIHKRDAQPCAFNEIYTLCQQ